MNKIVTFYVDGWEILFVNGKEQFQWPSIDIHDIIKFCPIESIHQEFAGGKLSQYVRECGIFPHTIKECAELNPKLSKYL